VPEVLIHEVGPRDGLQNEAEIVSCRDKLALLERLAGAGLRSMEVTSFVSPRWIPQLADADEVAAGFECHPGVSYSALVPNAAGYERFTALSKGRLDTVALFVSASETHNRKNVNRGIDAHLAGLRPVAERALAEGLRLRCYVSTACGCPYEGEVAASAAVGLLKRVLELGADQVSLGDTLGIGTPAQVRRLVRAAADEVPLARIGLHLHDTFGRALANVLAGYEEGVRCFDASLGGLGGCPYAPGGAGNVATEDVVDLLEREGVDPGVELAALADASAWLEAEVLRRPLPGRVYRAIRGQRGATARQIGAEQ